MTVTVCRSGQLTFRSGGRCSRPAPVGYRFAQVTPANGRIGQTGATVRTLELQVPEYIALGLIDERLES